MVKKYTICFFKGNGLCLFKISKLNKKKEALEIRKKIFASDHYLVQCSENNLKIGQKKLGRK